MNKDYPLSNVNLEKMIKETKINNPNIVETKDLNYIEDIFDNTGHIILFHKWKPNDKIGHWIPIIRKENGDCILFCSYGTDISEIKGLEDAIKRNSDIKRIFVNLKEYQSQQTNCCGRYSLFIIGCNKLGLDIDEIQNVLENGKKQKKNYDNFILSLFDK
jgi:hypothetical protein